MARIRTIKPDAFKSDSLSTLPRGTRWTFAGLWTYADDEGRGRDDVRLINAELYPLDDETTSDDVAEDMDLLEAAGCICRYEVGRKSYFHVPAWGNHQKINRPTESKLPPCPRGEECGLIRDESLTTHGALSEDSRQEKEQGREQGKGISCSPADAGRASVSTPDGFDEWWAAYPRKVGKGQARKAYKAATKKTEPVTLLSSLIEQAPKLMSKGPEYCPHPATWLNGERWADETPPPPSATATSEGADWMRRRPGQDAGGMW